MTIINHLRQHFLSPLVKVVCYYYHPNNQTRCFWLKAMSMLCTVSFKSATTQVEAQSVVAASAALSHRCSFSCTRWASSFKPWSGSDGEQELLTSNLCCFFCLKVPGCLTDTGPDVSFTESQQRLEVFKRSQQTQRVSPRTPSTWWRTGEKCSN